MSIRIPAAGSILAWLLFASSCASQLERSSPESWDAFVEHFLESHFEAQPTSAVEAGRHEYDGRLPDWSREGIEAEIERLRRQRQRATSFSDDQLDEHRRFEREYLVSEIDRQLFWLDTAGWPWRNPRFYAGPLDPDVYISREYAPLKQRMRAYIEYARNVPAAAEHIRRNLRTPLPESYVRIGRISFGGMATYLENDVPQVFANVDDRQLEAELREANEQAVAAMKQLDAWFAEQEAQATQAFALGTETFREMLRATEGVEVPLEELKEIGRLDMERNLESLGQACARFAPELDLRGCVQKSRADKPEEGPVEAARRQLDELKAFLVEKDLVSIPGTEEAKVEEAPPYQRWNFAYISIPGPYEQDLPSIYYIAPPDPEWSEQERQEYVPGEADLLFTSVHEVWPGHFLHFLHANRSASTFGQVFVGYAFAEGWAHYSEELMWEAGLGDGDPQIHIGQLLNALMRNARYLCAIGLHAEGMSQEACERLFHEKAFQDVGTARQQAARGTFDPAYLNYTLGKLMIKKLREDWTAPRGGREAWKPFHDRFLGFGGPPVPLVREVLLGEGEGSLF
ncbi:MAG TPA: DUF885 domain-containing protein [Thermoanaerobaculia bacterium]|nr:DUF885 domain-containing protein [Thermoanaerobaculia bacterium]